MQPVDVFWNTWTPSDLGGSYLSAVTEFLATKYGNRNVRVIVASAPQAVRSLPSCASA